MSNRKHATRRIDHRLLLFSSLRKDIHEYEESSKSESSIDAPVAARSSSSSSSSLALLNEETCDMLAAEMEGRIEIPLIPGPLVGMVWSKVVHFLFHSDDGDDDESSALLMELRSLLETESTFTSADDDTPEEVERLVAQMASLVNGKLDVPYLNETQEQTLLEQMCRIWVHTLTVPETQVETARALLLQSSLNITQTLLTPDSHRRNELATRLTERLDLPLLSEEAEQKVFLAWVNQAASALHAVLPPPIIQSLVLDRTSTTMMSLEALKQHLFERIQSNMVPIVPTPLIGKEEEMMREFINVVFDEFLLGNDDDVGTMSSLLLSVEEQRAKLVQRQELLQQEIRLNKVIHRKEQTHLKQQLSQVCQRIQSLEKHPSN